VFEGTLDALLACVEQDIGTASDFAQVQVPVKHGNCFRVIVKELFVM
jgi:hypothetical protein